MSQWQPQRLYISALKLGDVVKLFDGAWSTATVEKVSGHDVTMFRPYGTTADFTCADNQGNGNVICYIGTEHVTYPKYGSMMLLVLERRTDLS